MEAARLAEEEEKQKAREEAEREAARLAEEALEREREQEREAQAALEAARLAEEEEKQKAREEGIRSVLNEASAREVARVVVEEENQKTIDEACCSDLNEKLIRINEASDLSSVLCAVEAFIELPLSIDDLVAMIVLHSTTKVEMSYQYLEQILLDLAVHEDNEAFGIVPQLLSTLFSCFALDSNEVKSFDVLESAIYDATGMIKFQDSVLPTVCRNIFLHITPAEVSSTSGHVYMLF